MVKEVKRGHVRDAHTGRVKMGKIADNIEVKVGRRIWEEVQCWESRLKRPTEVTGHAEHTPAQPSAL